MTFCVYNRFVCSLISGQGTLPNPEGKWSLDRDVDAIPKPNLSHGAD